MREELRIFWLGVGGGAQLGCSELGFWIFVNNSHSQHISYTNHHNHGPICRGVCYLYVLRDIVEGDVG